MFLSLLDFYPMKRNYFICWMLACSSSNLWIRSPFSTFRHYLQAHARSAKPLQKAKAKAKPKATPAGNPAVDPPKPTGAGSVAEAERIARENMGSWLKLRLVSGEGFI